MWGRKKVMDMQDYKKIEETVKKQEQMLRFEHFSNKDAWEFGSFMVQKAYNEGIELAIVIRKLNGNIVFQHCTEGTNLCNENWMLRKFHTVSMMERSSFGFWAESMSKGESLATHALDEKDYALCGGGFPIWLKSGEIVGVAIVSNLPHEQDHGFIVDAMSEYLQISDVPRISAFE